MRRDVITLMKDVLDRIGLRAPEKHELKVRSEDTTPLITYEKRLELIREYKALGEPVPKGLGEVDLDG